MRWADTAAAVYDRYRGVHAWPQTTASFAGRRVKLNTLRPFGSTGESTAGSLLQGQPGEVLAVGREGLTVACGEGAIELLTVQPETRRPMPAADWWRGAGASVGARFDLTAPD